MNTGMGVGVECALDKIPNLTACPDTLSFNKTQISKSTGLDCCKRFTTDLDIPNIQKAYVWRKT